MEDYGDGATFLLAMVEGRSNLALDGRRCSHQVNLPKHHCMNLVSQSRSSNLLDHGCLDMLLLLALWYCCGI